MWGSWLIFANLGCLAMAAQSVFRYECNSDFILRQAKTACLNYKRAIKVQHTEYRPDMEITYDDHHNSAIESDIVGLKERRVVPYPPSASSSGGLRHPMPQAMNTPQGRPARSPLGSKDHRRVPNYAHYSSMLGWSFEDQYVELGPELRRYLRSPIKIRDVNLLVAKCCQQGCVDKDFGGLCDEEHWHG